MDPNICHLITDAINRNKRNDLENLLINENISSKCDDLQYAHDCKELLLNSLYINIDVFETLIKYINIDIKGYNEETALMSSIICNNEDRLTNEEYNNYSEYVLFILKYVKNINLLDSSNNNALQLYVDIISDHRLDMDEIKIEVISKMLELGSDIFNVNDKEFTGIDSILWTNNYDLIKLTLDNYINRGNLHIPISLLHKVIYRDRNYDIVELLLQYISDINELGENGRDTAWHINNSNPHPDIVELLLESGARL